MGLEVGREDGRIMLMAFHVFTPEPQARVESEVCKMRVRCMYMRVKGAVRALRTERRLGVGRG